MSVVVAGAGWAGLAAAATLSRHNIPLTLFESSTQLGGRARSLDDQEWHIDNGQHFMLGCYHHTLNLLRTLGIHEHPLLERRLLRVEIRSLDHHKIKLQVPNVAPPMHLLWGLMRSKGLDLHERGTALRLCARMIRNGFKLEQDQALEKWLLQNGQTRRLINHLWQPLCLALLNTPIKEASSRIFLRLMKKIFAREREDSDLLFIKPGLSDYLPLYAKRFIEAQQGQIHLGRGISALVIEANTLQGVMLDDEFHPCTQLILATPPWVTQQLLSAHQASRAIGEQIARLSHQPLCTVFLQYPKDTTLGTELIGLAQCTGHWIFDRAINGQPGLMAVTIHGPGKHATMDDETLAAQLQAELADLFPAWPRAQRWRVMREANATFACDVASNGHRPGVTTGVQGLWLAGDYLDTGYPARLEGAVKSGIMSAKAVLQEMKIRA